MWKRLNNPKPVREQPLGGPEYVVDTLQFNEKSSGASGLGITSRKEPQGRNRAPQRPPRDEDMIAKGLPRLPFEPGRSPPGPAPPVERNSSFRPASSIYSEPSPNIASTSFPRNHYDTTPSTTYTEEEVSPPSSPEFEAANRSQYKAGDGDVSPVERDMPDVSNLGFGRPSSRTGKPPISSIPVLRREAKRNQVATAAANFVTRKGVGDAPKGRINKDPRWDPYSGEITTSDRGKPQSVKPGEFAPPGVRNVHKDTGMMLGNETTVVSGQRPRPSFGDRVRKLKTQNILPPERPEWKGATGRAPIVSPVADNFDIAPLNIPRKSSKRVASPVSEFHSGSSSPVTVVRGSDGETSPISEPVPSLEPSIRTVLSNNEHHSPISVNPDPVVVQQSPAARTLARGPVTPTEVPVQHFPVNSPARIEHDFRDTLKDSFPPKPEPESEHYVQPPSRFSVTTYAPSEAQSSPRPSMDTFDRPPMPTPPQTYSVQASPIVNRRRPKVNESPKSNTGVMRKAMDPGSPVFISMVTSQAGLRRQSNIAKTLPMTPAETQSHDLVTSLQAQLDDLAHRRKNITKSIKQMTELMPQDSIMITEAVRLKRENEKLKVERLRNEEADVRREEHEIGLRLHRAWKRRDKDAVFEPTGLWVRRVTG